jgi:nicotinate-nucleotide adenylyltransferase
MAQLSRAGKRVAFFGGSFDPPHLGHLAVARAARAALALDTVLFAPVGAQPLKPQGPTASFEDRVAMTRLAIAGEPGFAVSLVDGPKPGAAPNYTIDTLLSLSAELAANGKLFCLMGADSFLGLRSWRQPAEIPFVASLIVASRPGQPLEDLRAALPAGLAIEAEPIESASGPQPREDSTHLRCYRLKNPAGDTAQLYLLPGLHVDISASQLREQIHGASGLSSPGPQLLSAAVLEYIGAHGLYR